MSDVADRLRALADAAGDLARGYADALDALAEVRRQRWDIHEPALARLERADAAAEAALAAAARLFPEDEA